MRKKQNKKEMKIQKLSCLTTIYETIHRFKSPPRSNHKQEWEPHFTVISLLLSKPLIQMNKLAKAIFHFCAFHVNYRWPKKCLELFIVVSLFRTYR